MNNRTVIFYQFNVFYQIMKELEYDLNLNVIQVEEDDILKDKISVLENYIIVSKKKLPYLNKLIFVNLTINIFKFIEKLNIKFLKINLVINHK